MSRENTRATVEKSIEIDAPPARVWEIVSEVRNAPQWSSQAVKVFATNGQTHQGTRALNLNKQGPVYWPTTSKVVGYEPQRMIANRIGGHRTVWSFELTPTENGGTRLTERQAIPAPLMSVVNTVANAVRGRRPEASEDRDGRTPDNGVRPSRSLRLIKTLAEQD